jgi:hypothetical protein
VYIHSQAAIPLVFSQPPALRLCEKGIKKRALNKEVKRDNYKEAIVGGGEVR